MSQSAKYTIIFEATSREQAAETLEGIIYELRDGTPADLSKPDWYAVLYDGDCTGIWTYEPGVQLATGEWERRFSIQRAKVQR